MDWIVFAQEQCSDVTSWPAAVVMLGIFLLIGFIVWCVTR